MYDVSQAGRFLAPIMRQLASILAIYCAVIVRVSLTIACYALGKIFFDAGAGFFLSIFCASLVVLIDNRVSISIGLALLVLGPIVLQIASTDWLQTSTFINYLVSSVGLTSLAGASDNLAVWAFYFFCIGVGSQIIRSCLSAQIIAISRFNNGR